MNGTYTAYLDRIVDGTEAVLLLEEDGTTVDELILDVGTLPAAGQHERALFEVDVGDGELTAVEYLPEEERKRRERIKRKSERLGEPLDNKKD